MTFGLLIYVVSLQFVVLISIVTGLALHAHFSRAPREQRSAGSLLASAVLDATEVDSFQVEMVQ